MNELLHTMLSHADPAQVPGLARFFKTGPGQPAPASTVRGMCFWALRSRLPAKW